MADQTTAYHIECGPTLMLTTDARAAVRDHPTEWSNDPWSAEERRAWVAEKYERDVAEAQKAGRPIPPRPEDPVVSEEQAAAEAEYDARLKEARMIVAEDDERKREAADYEAKVASARAFLRQGAPLQFEPERKPDPEAKEKARKARGEGDEDLAGEGDLSQDPEVEIPPDWRERKNSFRRGLAIKISGDKHITQDDANGIIEAEILRREAAKQG